MYLSIKCECVALIHSAFLFLFTEIGKETLLWLLLLCRENCAIIIQKHYGV